MNDDRQSRQIKGSGRTYFLDIEETKGGKPYLRITESRKGAGDKFERNSINVFTEDADEFAQSAFFGPDPPLAKPCVSASSLRADPDCRALRLLLLTSFAEEPPRSDLSPLRGSSPSLSVSAVGVFDADTQLASLAFAARPSPGPSGGPLGRRATCGGLGGLSANIFGEYPLAEYRQRLSIACLPSHCISHLLGSRVFNHALRTRCARP